MLLSSKLINRLFPIDLDSREAIEARYPDRRLPPDAEVMRFAPSPTGSMHIGGLFAALLSERLAKRSGGVFFLRIEDTDKVREVPGAMQGIIDSMRDFGIEFDEGPLSPAEEVGDYGPYIQSNRKRIYLTFARDLVERGCAYPCFATVEELERTAEIQRAEKIRPGYYGRYTIWRDRPDADVREALDAGRPFVIRLRSRGVHGQRFALRDLLKGARELLTNDLDRVLVKSDKLPTYHLAHVVDDRLMRTTLILRGDEWLTSTALHVQLTEAFGWEPLRYAHVSPIQKLDGTSRRKLSKRYDPEANVAYYREQGIPAAAVVEYLLHVASADFEPWRKANPRADSRDFELTLERITASSGALLDLAKLADISREVISMMPERDVMLETLSWASAYRPAFAAALSTDPNYTRDVLMIDRDTPKRRKDFAKWSDFEEQWGFFFDSLFEAPADLADERYQRVPVQDIVETAKRFLDTYSPADDKDTWFAKIRAITKDLGYAESAKEYRASPEVFRGSVVEVSNVLRVLVTGRTRSPDLYTVMTVMGPARVRQRVSVALQTGGYHQ
jgi:glutamyl-tRNA synthetase